MNKKISINIKGITQPSNNILFDGNKFKYPFKALNNWLETECYLQPNTQKLLFKIESFLQSFRYELFHKYNIDENYERIVGDNYQCYSIDFAADDYKIMVKPKNYETASLLFGEYVPRLIANRCYIQNFKDSNNDIYKVAFVQPKSGKVIIQNNDDSYILLESENINLNEYFKEKECDIDDKNKYQEKILIDPNKKYEGRMDGNFKIETINGQIYLIPLTSCIDFGEID